MTQTELPLYPKFSSIYNKIMQLAIAIFIIIVLMNLWVYSYGENKRALKQHFRYVSEQNLAQLTSGVKFLWNNNREQIQPYFDEMAQQHWIKDISLYDTTGQLLIATEHQASVKELYGLALYKQDKSELFTPFVSELRVDGKLLGYLRLTVENKVLTHSIAQAADEHYDLLRLMMILAGVVGFLLTRGLNRFSRQGFRLRHESLHRKK
ncbi:AhpA/YtjB family protein [Thalassotalea insulae]|nr:AhpA/YtjB family protein [Thalassotalea insulae]